MKFDKKMIDFILMMNDDQLWKTIQTVASKSGLGSAKTLEKPADMSKIRNVLAGLTEDDVARVTEILKRGK